MGDAALFACRFEMSVLDYSITGDIGESHSSEECFSCLQNLFPLGVSQAGVIIAALLIAERASFLCEFFIEGDNVDEGDFASGMSEDKSTSRASP